MIIIDNYGEMITRYNSSCYDFPMAYKWKKNHGCLMIPLLTNGKNKHVSLMIPLLTNGKQHAIVSFNDHSMISYRWVMGFSNNTSQVAPARERSVEIWQWLN